MRKEVEKRADSKVTTCGIPEAPEVVVHVVDVPRKHSKLGKNIRALRLQVVLWYLVSLGWLFTTDAPVLAYIIVWPLFFFLSYAIQKTQRWYGHD